MRQLGEIARLQIQRQSLTIGSGPTRCFDPAGLLVVDRLFLTPGGACALTADGSCIVDVHHAAHPFTRSRGENTLSFGFARHYETLRSRFGATFAFGCAAENIIIAGGASRVSLEEIAGGLLIETDGEPARLEDVIVAAPCLPFAKFALRDPEASTEAIKSAIQFMDHGLRGYYCAFTGPKTATICVGARVFAL